MMQSEQIFWDRLIDMPDIEAEQELLLRRDELVLQNAMLSQEKNSAKNRFIERDLGTAMAENNALLTKVNDEIKIIRQRMDRLNWRNAVKAVFGDDGYLKCRQWMEANR